RALRTAAGSLRILRRRPGGRERSRGARVGGSAGPGAAPVRRAAHAPRDEPPRSVLRRPPPLVPPAPTPRDAPPPGRLSRSPPLPPRARTPRDPRRSGGLARSPRSTLAARSRNARNAPLPRSRAGRKIMSLRARLLLVVVLLAGCRRSHQVGDHVLVEWRG